MTISTPNSTSCSMSLRSVLGSAVMPYCDRWADMSARETGWDSSVVSQRYLNMMSVRFVRAIYDRIYPFHLYQVEFLCQSQSTSKDYLCLPSLQKSFQPSAAILPCISHQHRYKKCLLHPSNFPTVHSHLKVLYMPKP